MNSYGVRMFIYLFFCFVVSDFFPNTDNTAVEHLVNYNDEIEACVKKLNSEYVKYGDGNVMFSDVPSLIDIILNGFAGSTYTAAGIFLLTLSLQAYSRNNSQAYSYSRNNSQAKEIFFCAAFLSSLPLAMGLYYFARTFKKIGRRLSSEPYIIFTREGLFCGKQLMLTWNQVQKIIARKDYFGTGYCEFDVAFKDNKDYSKAKELFAVSSDYLPTHLEVFCELIELYMQQARGEPCKKKIS